jgi:hypothetical protein
MQCNLCIFTRNAGSIHYYAIYIGHFGMQYMVAVGRHSFETSNSEISNYGITRVVMENALAILQKLQIYHTWSSNSTL